MANVQVDDDNEHDVIQRLRLELELEPEVTALGGGGYQPFLCVVGRKRGLQFFAVTPGATGAQDSVAATPRLSLPWDQILAASQVCKPPWGSVQPLYGSSACYRKPYVAVRVSMASLRAVRVSPC